MEMTNFNKAATLPLETTIRIMIEQTQKLYKENFCINVSSDDDREIKHVILIDNNNLTTSKGNKYILFDAIDNQVTLYELNDDDELLTNIKYNNVPELENYMESYIIDRFLNLQKETKTHAYKK